MLRMRKALGLACCSGILASLTYASGATQERQAGSPYRHLLFISSQVGKAGSIETDALVLGRLGTKGMTQRKLYEKSNLGIGLELLGAFQGRIYALKLSDLLSIDARTGKVTRVATGVESHDYATGRFFWLDVKGAIREYDLRKGRARRVTLGPIPQPFTVKLAASPDGERLALFVPTNEMAFGPAQLTVVRVADGRMERVGKPVEYYDSSAMIASSFSVRLPFLWLDSQHVAFVRNEGRSGTHGGTRGGTERLMQANAVTGEVSEVAALATLPEETMVSLERLPAPTFTARTSDGRQRYVIDPRSGRLTEGDSIGGAFHVREIHQGDGTTWRLYYGEMLLADSIGQQRPSVSPDGKQVVWVKDWELHLFDTHTGKTRTLSKGWFADSFLWLTDRDLAPPRG